MAWRHDPSPCGSTFLCVDDIQGRLEDSFTYEENLVIHLLAFRRVLGHFPNIVEYQVRQTERGAAVFLIANGQVNCQEIETKIAGSLSRSGLHDAEVSVEVVDSPKLRSKRLTQGFLPNKRDNLRQVI